jgi:hypothetical protein
MKINGDQYDMNIHDHILTYQWRDGLFSVLSKRCAVEGDKDTFRQFILVLL